MLKRVAMICALLGVASMSLAFTQVPGSAAGSVSEAPTTPAAPLQGAIGAVDLKAGKITIGGQTFAVDALHLAVLDRRAKRDGLVSLATLRPGMAIRYRLDRQSDPARVVEIWLLRNAANGGKTPP
jgi:hypothetical protein